MTCERLSEEERLMLTRRLTEDQKELIAFHISRGRARVNSLAENVADVAKVVERIVEEGVLATARPKTCGDERLLPDASSLSPTQPGGGQESRHKFAPENGCSRCGKRDADEGYVALDLPDVIHEEDVCASCVQKQIRAAVNDHAALVERVQKAMELVPEIRRIAEEYEDDDLVALIDELLAALGGEATRG